MKTLREICEMIELPNEVIEEVIAFDKEFHYESIELEIDKLMNIETATEGKDKIKATLDNDTRGIKILTCMLKSAIKTQEKYMEKGISEEIFVDTLKCFTRFVKEHYVSYGNYGFDRDFWVTRQLSMSLFRIGQLEYEITTLTKLDYEVDMLGEDKVISIHIPSDASISRESVKESYLKAKTFFNNYFKEYAEANMICDSWLLAPNLKDVLKDSSNIMAFQRLFSIKDINLEENACMEWVFKNDKIPLEQLPEDTSLQKNLKAYLLKGGKIGTAFGKLEEERI